MFGDRKPECLVIAFGCSVIALIASAELAISKMCQPIFVVTTAIGYMHLDLCHICHSVHTWLCYQHGQQSWPSLHLSGSLLSSLLCFRLPKQALMGLLRQAPMGLLRYFQMLHECPQSPQWLCLAAMLQLMPSTPQKEQG